MPIDSAEKRPYYVLIETNNALEGKTMKTAELKKHDPKAHAGRKLRFCINRAKECSYFFRVEPKGDKPEYRRMRREAMQDARYWRDQIQAMA